jgi:chromosome condensin MukBEF ATPase and DNA-binding subunit MukB
MFFNWFDAKEAVLIGIKLADDLSKELVKVNNKHSKKEMVSRAKVIQKVFSQFNQFKDKVKLNFYTKSKLINEFRWRLAELGHDNEFVEIATKELMLFIK